MYKEQVEKLALALENGYPLTSAQREWVSGLVRTAAQFAEETPPMEDGAYWVTDDRGWKQVYFVKDNHAYSTLKNDGEPLTWVHVSDIDGFMEKA